MQKQLWPMTAKVATLFPFFFRENVVALSFTLCLSQSLFRSLSLSLALSLSVSFSLSLSLFLSLSLSHIETAKPQRRVSLAPSLGGEKKLNGSSAIYILYHMYQQLHAQRASHFLIGRLSGSEIDISILLK